MFKFNLLDEYHGVQSVVSCNFTMIFLYIFMYAMCDLQCTIPLMVYSISQQNIVKVATVV